MRKFNNSFPGYNKNEVNSFVKNVTTEYESMLNNLKARDKEIESLKSSIERRQKLLSNPGYVNKAPEALVQEEREKLEREKIKLDELLKKYN